MERCEHPRSRKRLASKTVFGQLFIANNRILNHQGAGNLRGNRLLPFIAALALLAFALGSLPRAQPGGSLLFNSYWLIILFSIAPLIGLGLMVLLIALLIYNTGVLSEALGTGLSQRRKMKKKKGHLFQYIFATAAWSIAILLLVGRKGGLFGQHALQIIGNATIEKSGNQAVASTPPEVQTAIGFQTLFQSNWFYAAFFGLLVVCSVIVARSIIFSWKEGKTDLRIQKEAVRMEAIASVEDAFRILRAQPELDPRLRIINCYQRMVLAAQQRGARVTSDQTARELEAAIDNMLGIKGPSMRDLTNLFEEARYSLHPITEDDAAEAQQCLLNIAQEMNFTLSI